MRGKWVFAMTAASVWCARRRFFFPGPTFHGEQAEEIETKCANRFSGSVFIVRHSWRLKIFSSRKFKPFRATMNSVHG